MENKLKGGKADGMTIEDIAKKHKMDVDLLKVQLENGIKVEKEHSKNESLAKEIAMDHLFETPDYYIKLKKVEPKEQTMSDASGSYEGTLSSPITRPIGKLFEIKKKDISNFKSKEQEVKEQMNAGVSAVAAFDGPIGTAGPSSPMDKTKKYRKDPLKIDNTESKMGGASITGASSKDMIATKKGFPRFGGPDGKFVEINVRCKTYPYCDQGASSDKAWGRPNPIKLKEAIQEAAKKYGISVKQVEKIVTEALPVGIDFSPALAWGKRNKEVVDKFLYHLVTIDPETKQPMPLEFKTKDESKFIKLKSMLHDNGTKFHEEKYPIKDEGDVKVSNLPDEDNDADFADDDDIFANMK
jgi:hypothetical protein